MNRDGINQLWLIGCRTRAHIVHDEIHRQLAQLTTWFWYSAWMHMIGIWSECKSRQMSKMMKMSLSCDTTNLQFAHSPFNEEKEEDEKEETKTVNRLYVSLQYPVVSAVRPLLQQFEPETELANVYSLWSMLYVPDVCPQTLAKKWNKCL